MSYKILITDIASVLGRTLEHDLEREHCKLYSPKASELNWLDGLAVVEYIAAIRPDIVINTSGWDDVLSPEQQILFPRVAGNVAVACAPLGVPLLHFSSYKVFGGDSKGTHNEKDIPAPISSVGQAFFAAEQAIEHSSARAIILRLGWVIGCHGNNYLTRLLNSIQAQESVKLNSRLRGAPTLLSDVARVAVALVKQISCGADNWGILHYCSGDSVNEAEFCEQIVQLLAQQQLLMNDANFTLLDEISYEEPTSAVLGCRRIRDCFGVQARSWRSSLLPLVKQWFHNQQPVK